MTEKETTMKWEDVTSYSQGDTKRVPAIWKLGTPLASIHVHRHIHHDPDQWLVSCYEADIDCKELKSKDIEGAKLEAVEIVRDKFKKYLKALPEE